MPQSPRDVALVEVNVEPSQLQVGQTGHATAVPRDSSGKRVNGVGVELSLSIPGVLQLGKPQGAGKRQITALSSGTVKVYGTTTNLDGNEITGESIPISIKPVVDPYPLPIIEAQPSALFFTAYKDSAAGVESQEIVLNSGTSEALQVDRVWAEESVDWLELVDLTDTQVVDYEVFIYPDKLTLGKHETVLHFRYVHPVTDKVATVDVPVTVEVKERIIVEPPPPPPPVPEPDPTLPAVGKLHPGLLYPIVSGARIREVFGDTGDLFLRRMKEAMATGWATEGDSWSGDYYSRFLARIALFLMEGDPEEGHRAILQAMGYMNGYTYPNGEFQGPSAHWFQGEDLFWLATQGNNTRAREALARIANGFMIGETNRIRNGGSIEDDLDWRVSSRFIKGSLLIVKAGWPSNIKVDGYVPWAGDPWWNLEGVRPEDLLNWHIETALKWPVREDGALIGGQSQFCGVQFNWMVGMLCNSLMQSYDAYQQDPRVLQWIKDRWAYLKTQWVDSEWGMGFRYANGSCTTAGPEGAPDLTGLVIDIPAWLAARTGDLDYADDFREMFPHFVKTTSLQGSKQMNQAFRGGWAGCAYLIGMAD